MSPREFCYWLQGYFELNPGVTQLSPAQNTVLKNHLNMVFVHEAGVPPKTESIPGHDPFPQIDNQPVEATLPWVPPKHPQYDYPFHNPPNPFSEAVRC